MIFWLIALIVVVAAAGAAVYSYATFAVRQQDAQAAWTQIAAGAPADPVRFDPSMIAGLPAVAQRYFAHAIAPGTILSTVVELEMAGVFRLGDPQASTEYALKARQILQAPAQFVWMPDMRSGFMTISGSDGLSDAGAWTRFWINGLVPVVQVSGSADLERSALARPALESIWAPAALLPQNGASWTAAGENSAIVEVGPEGRRTAVELVLNDAGGVRSVKAMRWSNENPAKRYQLQPFGGEVSAERTFGGFTIPSRVAVGNHFGTKAYFPFMEIEITDARYQ